MPDKSTIKITKDQACELIDAKKGIVDATTGLAHEDDICTDTDRKMEYRLLVVKDAEGKIWGAKYFLEKGDDWMAPWEYDEGDLVEFKPARSKTVTTYTI